MTADVPTPAAAARAVECCVVAVVGPARQFVVHAPRGTARLTGNDARRRRDAPASAAAVLPVALTTVTSTAATTAAGAKFLFTARPRGQPFTLV